MKKTWKRAAAIALALCMMFNMLVFADTVDDGIEFTKTATVNTDNSLNVHMEAYTTGQVRNTSTTTPTDIILLLDMSGSMNDNSNVYEMAEVKGSSYRYGFFRTGYGFNSSTQYYIKNGEDYVPVSNSTRDDNGFEYYSANGVSYYPILEDGTSTNRENSYAVVQFYMADYKSHMEVLYQGASDFIAHTAQKNESITDPALKHRISIIKFADDSYYDGSEMTSDYTQAVIGNNRQDNGYNYTQVVSDFTVVDNTGKTALTNALGALQAGGATSVDYGMQLAISQFGKRTDAEGRNEVLILFTDGEPNHSSGYSASVAGSSINHAKNLKDTGVVIYSIGGENSADSSQIGDNYNAFMHYMSNNFPSASYSDGTITAGTGDVNGGYYMTATDDKDLSDIFDEILSKINFPTIELGPEARVIDTISEYFHIPDGANSVTLTVADKTASGWGTPYAATGVTATVNGQTLSVSGFDFDANHVSADGRGDNGDFYGRKLIIDVKITPDYADIDAAGLTDGKMPTNLGAALVVNSNGDTVDTAEPPIVEAKKVTYKVDGVETKHFYRFEGAEVTVDAEPTKVGHTFSGWSQTGTFTMPDADVVISGNFTADEYFVSYTYSGEVPAGATDLLPDTEKYAYGDTVTVADPVTVTGYTFSGWTPRQTGLDVTGGTFSMPANNVEFIGHFVPSTGTKYTVEHYLMDENGQYPTNPAKTEELKGTTGHTATATPLPEYAELYNFDPMKSTEMGVIRSDGSTVLKLYYARNKFDVVYKYEGDVPSTAPIVPATVSYYHGATVTVDTTPVVVEGYDFEIWHHHATEGEIDIVGGQFVMPTREVTLYGRFAAKTDIPYKVEHYIANADNTGYESTPYQTNDHTGTTGETVTAQPITITGFTYNDADSALTKTGVITADGQLVLKLYYNRNKYNVSYDYEGDTQGLTLPTLPTGDSYYYGQTVTVAGKVSINDYEFHGWYIDTESNMVTDFEMPARDVVLLGHFVANTATPYTVEHYLMGIDGQYPSTPEDTETFKGTTGHTVTATPLLKYDGFTYDDVKSALTKTGVIGNDLVLKLYYERNRYDVIYQYERTVPTEAEPVPATESYYHGETVEVADDYVLAGYTFSGWHRHEMTVTDSFVMPTADVTLYGYYEAKTDTKYTVEHYIANLDNTTYPDTPYQSQILTGTSGAEITATPITIDGFTYNDADSALTKTGVIKGDGTLVLKLYYKRNEYTVSYAYEGDTMGLTPPPRPATETYVKGEKVTVAPTVTLQGYVFVGWYFGDVNSPATGTFTMPARNVVLVGHFQPSEDNGYKVSHWLQGTDGQYPTTPTESEYRNGATGTFVSAVSKVYDGFDFDPAHPDTLTSANIKADGSLELKFFYKRLSYDVKYVLDGTQPYGVTATVPTDYNTTELYGTSVSVKPDLSQIGYTFSGWSTEDAQVSGGNFDMPAKTVTFKGKFVANTNNHYKVEYYLQKLDNANEYELALDDTITATTGQLVTAEVKNFEGFTPRNDNVISAYVAGDGSTVIKIYYDRIIYNVEYRYYGEAPSCASALPATKTGVPFGAKLTVEPDAICTDGKHVFDGWKSPHVTPVNGEYTIPLLPNNARTVVFYGMFEDLHDVIYDLNGGTGADGVDYSTVKYEHGTVVTIKDAPTKARHTFTGWKAENADYQPGDDHTVTADITFVAQWRSNGGGGGVTPVTRYTLTYESNGGTKYSPERYAEGTLVNLTKVPMKEGFVFDGWHLDEGLTQYVTEVKMDKDITVYAHWVEDNGGAGNGSPTPSMLNGDDHFAYIVGYEDGTLRPENNITRAEVTTIFFRLLKDDVRKDSLTSNNSYTDIPADAWYNTSISTMSAMGIVGGKSAGKFAPGAFITRAEFAVICARFDDSDFEIVDHFGDVAGHWAEAEIHEAAAHGWIKGYEDGSFRPDALITRAEAVTMINRVLNRIPETKADLLANMIIWPDNDEDDWFYLAMCEATNSHNFDMKNHVYEKWTSLRENPDWAQYQ
ncbi:MAG: InlB B-repeat-containing protein [Clostridia bacterium]|nr:InlB B-repeat-containing protein [Clostridia bacterium]